MSSRDRSGRPGGNGRSSNHRRTSESAGLGQRRSSEPWDIDPAEIDRYLSGRPTRAQEESGPARGRSSQQGTVNQLDRLQRQRQQASQARRPYRPAATGREQFVEPDDRYPDDTYDDYEYDPGFVDDGADDYVEPEPTRVQRSAPRQPRQPVYHDEDELYADDPYLTYDDDYGAPPPRETRQRPQINRQSLPSMPKLSMPRAISDAELVNDVPSLALIGVAVLSFALMAIIVSNRIAHLPATIPTHVSANGIGEALKGRDALWSVPILAAALSLMNIAAGWFLARIDLFAARFLLGASLLVQFVAWIAVIKYLW